MGKKLDNSFSIIIPVFKGGAELEVCIGSLQKNSRLPHEIIALVDPDRHSASYTQQDIDILSRHSHVRVFKNPKNLGPYGSWNRGARLASKGILCFTTQDIYFAPDWDRAIVKYLTPKNVLTAQTVEPGIIRPYHANLIRNFGLRADEFEEAGFIDFVKRHAEERLAIDGFFVPTVIHKTLFNALGRWPDRRPFPYPNDTLFRRILWKRGLEYKRVMESFAYHFQDGKNYEVNGGGFYFDRKERPPRAVLSRGIIPKLKSRMSGKLIQLGFKKVRVSGWTQRKRADLKLAYRYCTGRGVEIGAGSNRFPNINAVSVDLYTDFKERVYPKPDVIASAYDLSFLKDESRDFVITSHLLEHLINPLKALKEWKRVMRPGGVLFLIVPDKRYVPIPTDNRAAETTLKELLERERLDLTETDDENPATSSRSFWEGQRHGVFHPKGKPGWRHFSYWTPQSLKPVLEHLGLQVVETVEAPEKNRGLDLKPFYWDDFTIVARKVGNER